jgi:hypothetical protein
VKCERKQHESERRIAALKEFLVRIEFAVFAGVIQGNVGVGSFIDGVNLAAGIRMGIDVDAGGTLIEFGEIQNLVDGLFALDGAGVIVVHIVGNAGREAARATRRVLIVDAKILDAQFANGHGHPAILSAMIVDAADLANFPADGHHFEEVALKDEIPSVVALGVKKIRLEGVDADLISLKIFFDFRKREIFAMDGGKAAHPFVDGHLRHGSLLASRQRCGKTKV